MFRTKARSNKEDKKKIALHISTKESHKFHQALKNTWSINIIPNTGKF